jgi:hypothetical protein
VNAEVDVFPAVETAGNTSTSAFTGGWYCSLKELLMIGIIMPETC